MRAEISRRTHRSMSRDPSYETDSGPKTKTVFHIIFALFLFLFWGYGIFSMLNTGMILQLMTAWDLELKGALRDGCIVGLVYWMLDMLRTFVTAIYESGKLV